jgi:Tol biopolymer transport system component
MRQGGSSGPRWVALVVVLMLAAVGSMVLVVREPRVDPDPSAPPVLANGRFYFAVGEGPGGRQRIAVAGPDGQDPHLLPGEGIDGWFSVSPDGSRIAYSDFGIWVMDADGSGATMITEGFGADPAWSPDGRWLAFESDGIVVVGADGASPRRLTSDQDRDPAWSRDGRFIAFTRGEECPGCGTDLFVIPAIGGIPTNVTRSVEAEQQPAWSPNGRRLVFLEGPSHVDAGRLMTIRVDGKDRRPLGDEPDASSPAWSPDGSRISFRARRGIWTIRADGRGLERVLDTTVHNDRLNANLPQTGGWLDGSVEWEPLICTTVGTYEVDHIRGTPGDDVICGMDGDDVIEASGGSDVVVGGSGRDQVTFAEAPRAVVVDLGDGVSTGWGDGRVYGVEDVVGSRFDDFLSGSAGSNRLDGLEGDDVLTAGRTAPRLLCGIGITTVDDGESDVLVGGSGNDDLAGGQEDSTHGEGGTDRCLGAGGVGCERTELPTVDRGPPLRPRPIVRRANGAFLVMGPYQRRAVLTTPAGEAIRRVGPRRGYGAPEADAVWSPDGKLLAYVGGGRPGMIGIQHDFIYVSDADGSELHKVTTGGPVTLPGWTPDGRVTFVCEGDLWAVRPDGTGVRRIVDFDMEVLSPVISPDGAWVGFSYLATPGSSTYQMHLGVMLVEGGPVRDVSGWLGGDVRDVAWSPDGTRFAFSAGEPGTGSSLYVIDAEGGIARRLARRAFGPSWSPDGEWILFGMAEEGANDTSELHVYRIHPDGTHLELIRHGYAWYPRWQPGPVVGT